MAEFINTSQFQVFFQLLFAVFLGALVGLEREYKRKEAGLKTYALICLGAALFTIVGLEMFKGFSGMVGISFDPSTVIHAVAIGTGFIAGGVIIYRQFHIEGLTTAVGLWIVAAIGVAVGAGFYVTALFAASLVLLVLSGFRSIEEKFLGTKKEENVNS